MVAPLEDVPALVLTLASRPQASPERPFRVVVLESDADPTVRDFSALEDALNYADDAASESDVPWPLAYVFDGSGNFIRRGRHYAAR